MRNKNQLKTKPNLIVLLVILFLMPLPVIADVGNKSFLLSVDEAATLKRENPKTIYVDVRDKEKFNKSHILSSINIPLHFVRTKQYLKNMEVVLIGEGYQFERLYVEHLRLRKTGYRTHILVGGIAAWHQRNKELASDSNDSIDLHLLPASKLLEDIRSETIKMIIDVSSKSAEPRLDDAVWKSVASIDDVRLLMNEVNNSDIVDIDIIVIASDSGNYDVFYDFVRQFIPTVFFLEGGKKSYVQAVAQQKAMLAPKEERIRKIGGCETCPPSEVIKFDDFN